MIHFGILEVQLPVSGNSIAGKRRWKYELKGKGYNEEKKMFQCKDGWKQFVVVVNNLRAQIGKFYFIPQVADIFDNIRSHAVSNL